MGDLRSPFPVEEKHKLLKLFTPLQQNCLRLDDGWTQVAEVQQKEMFTLDADFQSLKGNGYKPFFIGSVLIYRRNDKVCVCHKYKADTVPSAA